VVERLSEFNEIFKRQHFDDCQFSNNERERAREDEQLVVKE
jgi:hypothetical protein